MPGPQGSPGEAGRRGDGREVRAAAPGVDGVLTEDATMAIKMQMGSQNRQWPGCGLHERHNTVAAPAETCGSTRLRHNKARRGGRGRGRGRREQGVNLDSWPLYPRQFQVGRKTNEVIKGRRSPKGIKKLIKRSPRANAETSGC